MRASKSNDRHDPPRHHRKLIRVCAAALAMIAGACSTVGPAQPGAAPKAQARLSITATESAARARPLSDTARRVRFGFSLAQSEEASAGAADIVKARLMEAGYQLVQDDDAPADARVVMSVVSTRDSEGELQVTLTLFANDLVIESFVTPIQVADQTASIQRLHAVVDHLTESPRLSSLANAIVAAHTPAHRAPKVHAQGPREDELWSANALRWCINPRNEHSCDKVMAYLAAFPDGEHAAEANAALAVFRRKTAPRGDE